VTLFLAWLGAITGSERYTALARLACAGMRRRIEDDRPFITWIGGFVGWGGILYALTHLAALWSEPELLDEAERIVELLPPLVERDEQLDIIGGAAGCIGSLLSLYRQAPSNRTLAVAIQCGDRLVARAEPVASGVGWVNPLIAPVPLTGFAHGGAGMAWALMKLTALTGEERLRTTALAAIDFERSQYRPEARNWRDLRTRPEGDRDAFRSAWCHGAPGIGLARLSCLDILDNPDIRAEIDTALATTVITGFCRNRSLCHGDLGNLQFLLEAGHDQVSQISGMVLEIIRSEGWLCGTPLGVESPGLMTGLAGIGYGLLRLAEPARVPLVLTLAPPVSGLPMSR
jgi:type 2 lantibiotic biosynthesis protein LanM